MSKKSVRGSLPVKASKKVSTNRNSTKDKDKNEHSKTVKNNSSKYRTKNSPVKITSRKSTKCDPILSTSEDSCSSDSSSYKNKSANKSAKKTTKKTIKKTVKYESESLSDIDNSYDTDNQLFSSTDDNDSNNYKDKKQCKSSSARYNLLSDTDDSDCSYSDNSDDDGIIYVSKKSTKNKITGTNSKKHPKKKTVVDNCCDDSIQSEFYQGSSIINTLNKSAFKKIKLVVDKLIGTDPETLNEYKLPKVLIIGHESVGKSSLIENITKCQIFPRDSSVCTKAPLRLVLKNGNPSYRLCYKNSEKGFVRDKYFVNKSDIYSEIDSIMKSISVTDITHDEITVEITDIDVPDFEFIDLPGIRVYPEADAKITTEITQSYLKMYPDSIIICVVPSVTPSLTSCKSIALIKEANLEKNCVLVMTMVDRLQSENIENLLINRLVGKSDELNNFSFACVIGVINRLHTDKRSLQQNDAYEKKWFDKFILSHLNATDTELINNIKRKITLPCLLKQIDRLYNQSIKTYWRPKISEKVTNDTNDLNKQLAELGPEILTGVEITDLVCHFLNKLKDFESIPKAISCSCPNNQEVCHREARFENTINGLNIKTKISGEVSSAMKLAVLSINDSVRENFDLISEQHKLHHFSNIKNDLIVELDNVSNALKNKYLNHYVQIATTYIDLCIVSGTEIKEGNVKLILDIVRKTFKVQLLSCPIKINNDYNEDVEYATTRESIRTKISSLSNYLKKIHEINLD